MKTGLIERAPYIERPSKPAPRERDLTRQEITAADAGLADVSPHVLRHTAAVHTAEAGISMDEIAQYLGHSALGSQHQPMRVTVRSTCDKRQACLNLGGCRFSDLGPFS